MERVCNIDGTCNISENKYKQALKEVLINLRSLDLDDKYINESIKIITTTLEEEN